MGPLPLRGPEVRSSGLALPPARMPLLKRGRPLKRWRYVALYRPDFMVCVGDARVAGIPQRWWALALPDGIILEGRLGGVSLCAGPRARGRGGAAARSCIERGAGRGGGLAARALVDLDAQAGAASGRAGRCAAPRAHGRWTATRRSSTSPPATTRGTRPGTGRPASAGRWTAAPRRGTSSSACTTRLQASERTLWLDGEPSRAAAARVRRRPLPGRRPVASPPGPRARTTRAGSCSAATTCQPFGVVRRVAARRRRARRRVRGHGVARRPLVSRSARDRPRARPLLIELAPGDRGPASSPPRQLAVAGAVALEGGGACRGLCGRRARPPRAGRARGSRPRSSGRRAVSGALMLGLRQPGPLRKAQEAGPRACCRVMPRPRLRRRGLRCAALRAPAAGVALRAMRR